MAVQVAFTVALAFILAFALAVALTVALQVDGSTGIMVISGDVAVAVAAARADRIPARCAGLSGDVGKQQ